MERARTERPHRRLRAWVAGIELVKEVYALTGRFPTSERFGLTAQMRRAAVSVCSNIAEGAARGSRREFCRFLNMANGSLSELDTQLVIAEQLGYAEGGGILQCRIDEVGRLVAGLRRKLAAVSDGAGASRREAPSRSDFAG